MIKAGLLILFLLLSGPSLADVAKGYHYFQEGLYPEALSEFNREWLKNPQQRNYESYIDICKKMIQAQNQFEEASYDEAVLLTEEVAILVPKDKNVQTLLQQRQRAVKLKKEINFYFQKGDHAKVLSLYKQLLDFNPKDTRSAKAVNAYQRYSYQLDNARQLFRKGEWYDSLAIYKKAWTMFPADSEVQRAVSMNTQAIYAWGLYQEGSYREAAYLLNKLFEGNSEIDIFRLRGTMATRLANYQIDMNVAFAEGDFIKARDAAQALLAINALDRSAQKIYKEAEEIIEKLGLADKDCLDQKYEKAYKTYKYLLENYPGTMVFVERERIAKIIIAEQEKKNEKFSQQALADYVEFDELKNYVDSFMTAHKELSAELNIVKELITLRNEGIYLFEQSEYAKALDAFNKVLQINALDEAAKNYRFKTKQALLYIKQIKSLYQDEQVDDARAVHKKLMVVNPKAKPFELIITD